LPCYFDDDFLICYECTNVFWQSLAKTKISNGCKKKVTFSKENATLYFIDPEM